MPSMPQIAPDRGCVAAGARPGAEGSRVASKDAGLLLELARTTVDYRERTGEGDLDRAIAACRVARDEHPVPESLYWEGRCQSLAGRTAKARACFTEFLEQAKGIGKYNKLVAAALRASA